MRSKVKLLGSSCLLLAILYICFGCGPSGTDSGTGGSGDNNVFPPLAQVVNNSGADIYKVTIGNTAFILTGYGSNGGSTGFSEVPKGMNNVVIYPAVGSSPITVGSLGSFLDNNLHTSAYAVNIQYTGGSYSAELWQMPDTSTPFNQNTTKIFIATASAAPTYNSISGAVSGAVSQGVTINLTGAATANTITDASGNYSFPGLANGSYTVTPAKTGYTFSPISSAVSVGGTDVSGKNFTATASTAPTYSISGVVSGAVSQGGTINLTGATTGNTITDAGGNYSFPGLANGSYTLTPSKIGYTFSPTSSVQTVNGANITSVNFTGIAATGVSQFDGTYTGSWSSTCPVCGDGTATGTFTSTLDNGVFKGISLPITSGSRSIRFDSGTVSSSGVITATGATPSGCSSSVSTITGQITSTLSGGYMMDMTYSRPKSVEGCEAEYGTITATY